MCTNYEKCPKNGTMNMNPSLFNNFLTQIYGLLPSNFTVANVSHFLATFYFRRNPKTALFLTVFL